MSSKVTIILDPERYAHYLRFVVRYGDFCIGWFYLNPSGFSPVLTLRTMGKCTTTIHKNHYSGVIMGTVVSEITSLIVVYSTVYPTADQRKHQSNASLVFVRWIHQGAGEFPAQMASNAENVSLWWRHHDDDTISTKQSTTKPVRFAVI